MPTSFFFAVSAFFKTSPLSLFQIALPIHAMSFFSSPGRVRFSSHGLFCLKKVQRSSRSRFLGFAPRRAWCHAVRVPHARGGCLSGCGAISSRKTMTRRLSVRTWVCFQLSGQKKKAHTLRCTPIAIILVLAYEQKGVYSHAIYLSTRPARRISYNGRFTFLR